jgi:hypothetical protein
VSLAETLDFSDGKTVSLSGGYDTDFSAATGFTTVSGSLKIGGAGTLTISRIIFR